MDAQRLDEMSDAALDRDLQALLAADPSPAFVARVRMQIAAEATTSRPWFSAWSAGLAVAATIAVVIVTLAGYRGSRGQAVGERPAALSTRPIASSNAAAGVGLLVAGLHSRVLDRLPRRSRQMSVAAPRAMASAEPEVLVDPREAAALRALIRGMRNGAIDLAPVLTRPLPAAIEAPEVATIDIPVITIQPIAPGTGAEGVRK
jgi:hypothetical protein